MPSHELKVPNTDTRPTETRAQEITTQEITALETRLRQIHTSYQKGQWAQAIAYCETVIDQCNQRLQKQSSAVQPPVPASPITESPITESSSTVPPAVELYIAKGDLFSGQQKLIDAIRAYEQALSLQPEQPELLKKIGDLYVQHAQQAKAEGGVNAAVCIYLQALQKHPQLFVIYNRLRYNLMRYETAKGEPILEEVIQVFREIVAQKPRLLAAQVTLGYALMKAGHKEAAIATYRHATEISTRRQIAEKLNHPESAFSIKFSQRQRTLDYLIIGAEKSGTTSLYQYLSQHPEVLSSVDKEIDFFDIEHEHGLDWYLAHFPPVFEQTASEQTLSMPQKWLTQKWLIGETSANYLYSNVAPERVFQHFPNIQLAVILRNPIDRTVSRYNMMRRNGVEQRTLETAIQEEITLIESAMMRASDGQTIPWPVLNRCRHVGNSLYVYHLKRWLSIFPAKQLFVIQSEDLFTQPAQTLTQLYKVFGLSPHTGQDYPKYNAGQYNPAEAEIRQRLSVFFEPHTRKLEALLGRSFNWSA